IGTQNCLRGTGGVTSGDSSCPAARNEGIGTWGRARKSAALVGNTDSLSQPSSGTRNEGSNDRKIEDRKMSTIQLSHRGTQMNNDTDKASTGATHLCLSVCISGS